MLFRSEQKEGLEFGLEEYQIIDEYCKSKRIQWFASAWDVNSQNFLKQFNLKHNKVASALLTHRELIEEIAKERKYTFISTGMSTLDQIQKVVEIFRKYDCPFELMHCNSEYPMPVENANLKTIQTLKQHFNCNVGYSGHETDTLISSAAVEIGRAHV